MPNSIKQIRGQIRQIVKDLLPEIITTEFLASLQQQNTNGLAKLTEEMNKRLADMDSRARDVQRYIMREISSRPGNKD